MAKASEKKEKSMAKEKYQHQRRRIAKINGEAINIAAHKQTCA